ncbi:MAG TPA: ribonuclease Z [Gemmatimonadales bacterium]|jgi:ribonuclease Z|nr:ribonuclease Z [Gemmatimonadales bacterium]
MMQVTFLGTSAAVPTVERNVASLMLQREGEHVLFDCGEGTQRQMMRYGAGFSFDDLFFTHFHADHTLGLAGLLRTLGLQGRTAPLNLHGPRGAKRHLSALITLGMERMKFPVEITELKAGDALPRGGGEYDLLVGEAAHRGDAVAYAVVEHDRLGRFDPERARELGIPEGPAWGRLHRGEAISLPDGRKVVSADLVGPARPGRRVVYSGDSAPCAGVAELARGADLLIHEATFGEDERDRARETMHSTARDAATLAARVGVKKLVLTHISARYSREAPELAAEAREVFPETAIARDGMVVEVPFPDAPLAG